VEKTVSLLLPVVVIVSGCEGKPVPAPSTSSGPPPAVRDVDDQEEALNEFRKVDLPAIERADKLVITLSGPKGGQQAKIDDLDELREFRNALVVKKIPPSGGMNWAELEWFRDGTSLRKVWVFSDGEWGVTRPGISYTTGISPGIVGRIEKALKSSEAPGATP